MLDKAGIFGDFELGEVDKVNSLIVVFGENTSKLSLQHFRKAMMTHHIVDIGENPEDLTKYLAEQIEEDKWNSITLLHTGTEEDLDYVQAISTIFSTKRINEDLQLTLIDLVSDEYDDKPIMPKFRGELIKAPPLELNNFVKHNNKSYTIKLELTGRAREKEYANRIAQLVKHLPHLTYKDVACFLFRYDVREDKVSMYRISEGEPRYEVHIEEDTLRPIVNYHNNLKSLDAKHRFNEYPSLAELANKYFPNPIAVTIEVDQATGVIKRLTAQTKKNTVSERISSADDFIKILALAREGVSNITLITETEEEKKALDSLYKESSADAPLSFYTYCDILRYYFKNLAPVLDNYDIEFTLDELLEIYSTDLNPLSMTENDKKLQTVVTEIYGNTPTKEYIKVRHLDSYLLKSLEGKISEEDYISLRTLTREYELYVELLYNQYKHGK